MKQKFLEDTIESKFIKALLYNTYLPTYNSIDYGDYMIKDILYIFKEDIVKCTKSGVFGETANFDTVSSYTFGLPYPKYTSNYVSKYSYYDSETHRRLGDYLRYYRDICDINLMPFYNCFTGRYTSGLKVTKDSGVVSGIMYDYKIFKVPIKFNKKYTVAIDSQSKVTVGCALINDGGFVTMTPSGTLQEIDFNDIFKNTPGAIKELTSTSFNRPFTYEVTNKDSSTISGVRKDFLLQQYENELYMIIQVSNKNDSSLVVLEGDYTQRDSLKVFSADYLPYMSSVVINQLLLSKLSLLTMNDHISYPFSDRLIEYLLQNVIDCRDTTENNILTVQKVLETPDIYYEYKNIWTDELREDIYQLYTSDKRNKNVDITGFVDKDVEQFLIRKGVSK